MMLIREFERDDFDIYCKMSVKFYESGASLVNVPVENYTNTFEACLSSSPFLKGYLVFSDGEPAGYFLLTYTWYNEFSGETVTLDEIYVDDKFRGRGLGTKIIEWVYNTHSDYKGIQLEVKKDNQKAIDLYTRIGFEFMDYCQMVIKPKEIYHNKK